MIFLAPKQENYDSYEEYEDALDMYDYAMEARAERERDNY